MVSMLIGAVEWKYKHVTRQTELFMGVNRGDPYHFASLTIDAGADIVWRYDPQVLKALDLYIDRFIAYRLGNFATYETINVGGINGYTPPVAVETNRDGRLLGGRIYSCLQEKGTGP